MLLLTLSMRLGLNALMSLNPSFGSRFVFFLVKFVIQISFLFRISVNFGNGISLMLLVMVHGLRVKF